jgi:NADPH-dependent 2,4-dienoyl-CoA reductase/sulfur reductase-like enzyme/pSer/pThr/pTyr-binding forkhead associated (FHA) protein
MEQSQTGDVFGGFIMPGNISYLIIGNGIAGVPAAEILRYEDLAADITVIADDHFPVYYRPALKDYLAGRVREDKLWARPNSFYQDHRIRFLSDRVVGIQAGQHTVQVQSGRDVTYNRLLLANGARASRLNCPGIDLVGVTTLRTVADYQAVVSHLGTSRRIVVSGSGTLALETIETLRHRGYQVTHLLRRRTLWSEVLDATASDLVLQQERRDRVDVRLEEEIAEVIGKNGMVSGVITTSGARIACDMVIIAIGVEPIIDFIKSSGIPCGRGVQVDSTMRTSAPDIYAAGDILETTDTITRRTRVIGQWYPAIQQARAAAYSMLDLLDTSYPFQTSTFYNATFLYGLDFASIGLTQIPKDEKGYQEIIGDPLPRSYRKVILKDGIAVGMLSLGNRKDALAYKRAIDHNVNLSPVASQLFTEDFKLNDWLDRAGVPPPLLRTSRKGAAAIRQAAYEEGTLAGATILKPQPIMEALLIPDADNAQAAIPLSQTKVMTVGRQAGSYLLIDHDSVSRRHAEISFANEQYVLRDLGSSNGTFVNEVHLEADKALILKPDDRIRFGKMKFTFQVKGVRPANDSMTRLQGETLTGITKLHDLTTGFFDPEGRDKSSPYTPSGQPILHADGSLLLPGATEALSADIVATFKKDPALIVLVHGSPQVVYLKQGRSIILGRDKTCDVVLADIAASRRHAEVFPGPDGFYIHDLGSANGLVVNQMKIDNPYLLVHSDRIMIGGTVIFYMNIRQEDYVSVIADPEQRVSEQGQNSVIPNTFASLSVNSAKDLSNALCRNCGASNISIARFCATCGTPLENPQVITKGE